MVLAFRKVFFLYQSASKSANQAWVVKMLMDPIRELNLMLFWRTWGLCNPYGLVLSICW